MCMKKTILIVLLLYLAGSLTSFADIVYENDYEGETVGGGFPAWNWGDNGTGHNAVYADYDGNIVVEHTGTIGNSTTAARNMRFGSKWDITLSGNTSSDPADYFIAFDIRSVSGNWDPINLEFFVLTKEGPDQGYGSGVSQYAQADGWIRVVANLADLSVNWWEGQAWNMTNPSWSIEVGGPPYPGTSIPADTPEWDQIWLMDNLIITMGEEPPSPAAELATEPVPDDGAFHADTWVSLSWRPGDFAVSHDVYFGENFDDVNNGTRDSDVYRGNLGLGMEFFIAGFSGYPYPDGLVNGTAYYWRIDEVNDADPNSPWKGDVWSFTITPKTAYMPEPVDGAEFVALNKQLQWTAGHGAKIHYVVFGEDFDEVSNAATGTLNGTTSYNPGPLKLAKTYYWRVDESDGSETYKGEVWSFTTEGAISGPNPEDGAVNVKPSVMLTWVAGAVAASHDVYFGMDSEAVKNATKASPEYKGPKALGEESYDPGKLTLNTTYYWRIDEVNGASSDSPWEGNVWSFTTGDYFVIDDFEDYDAADNQIWFAWHDGLGAGTPGTPDYLPGNGTGSAVGDETTLSYTEETIIHGGNQSMPIVFDNNKQGFAYYSEVELTFADQRDWTAQGVAELSLWFRGYPASVGSFVEGPVGTYTMTASGADIWAVNGVEADEFHFAYKMLTGAGSIIAKVESLENTNNWAKAGVMIRESLNPDSAHAFACITPGNGVASQYRPSTGGTSENFNQTDITAPYWVKLERSISGFFTVTHSANGTNWQLVTGATELNIAMGSNVYIGLALTSHDAVQTCQAVFSNVTTAGSVTGQWTNQDIGIESNDPEPLYVAISNSTGNPAVIIHDDADAVQIDTWTEWIVPLQAFTNQGIDLTNVDRIAVGLGTQGNTTVPGGKGKIYVDDIRLYQPREVNE